MSETRNDLYPILQRVSGVKLGESLEPIADDILHLVEAGFEALPPRAWVNVQCNASGCVAMIQMPKEPLRKSRYATGTGPTRIDAIRAAVASVEES